MKTAAMISSLVFFIGCGAYSNRIVKESHSGHAHYYPNVKNAGDYHVTNFMDRRSGKIGVMILNRYEEPYFLEEANIEAEITLANGSIETVSLEGEGYLDGMDEGFQHVRGATLYSKRFTWVQKAHSALLKAWVPLADGKTYELTFEYKAREPMPEHSGIITK
jgi:hypothetical protein